MKIAEETGDDGMKENAKVNFGMANASLKWNGHMGNIMKNVDLDRSNVNIREDEDEEDEAELEREDKKREDLKEMER
jgi:hypothetical protein